MPPGVYNEIIQGKKKQALRNVSDQQQRYRTESGISI